MNRYTLFFVLTMSVLLGSSGVCWSADFQKGTDAYERGDYATAFKEFTPLAEQGDAGAQYNLGVMYGTGRGVPLDYVRAHMWFNLSTSTGEENMIKGREFLEKKMTPSQIEQAQNLARECIAKNYKGC